MFKFKLKAVLALALAVISFFTMTAFSFGGKKEEVTQIDVVSSAGKVENSVLQYPATNEYFRYNVFTYYIEISECLTTNANIVIPDTIQDLPVLKIADNVFKGVTTLKTVAMTNNVISIGQNAFAGCINLSNITLSSNLETIGSAAFFGCYNLKAITIPSKVMEIPTGCFADCSRLMAVSIEETEKAPVAEEETEVVQTEEEVRSISSAAFGNCVNLRSVWIPSDVTEIADTAFAGSLEFLTIYGQAQSAAAQYASENLVDFVVLGNESFHEILANASYVEKRKVGDSIEGEYWKINLSKVYVFRGSFKYYDGTSIKTHELENGKEMIVYCFIAKNVSSSSKFFNLLNANPQIDGYNRKVSAYGQFADERLAAFPGAIAGDVDPGALIYGYVAVEAPRNWQNASMRFSNDMIIESNVFEINSMSDDVIYVGSSDVPQTDDSAVQASDNSFFADEDSSSVKGETTSSVTQEDDSSKTVTEEVQTTVEESTLPTDAESSESTTITL